MGMFGEINAEANAKELEGIILDLIKGSDWSDVRSVARAIAKKKLYKWYLNECSEGCIPPNGEIVKELELRPQPLKPSCWKNCTRQRHGTIEECQNCADRPDGYNMYNRRVGNE